MGKSLWSFRARIDRRYRIHMFAGITIAFVIDHFTADFVVNLLGLPEWLASYYVVPFVLLAIWVASVLNRED